MAGQFGVDESKKIVGSVAELLNVVDKVVHKAGLIALLGAIAPINVIKSVNFSVFKQELGELSKEEREAVELEFKSKLQLQDQALQAKFVAMTDCLDKAVVLVEKALGLFNDAKALVAEVKAILGVQ
jgi:hypothetical protein